MSKPRLLYFDAPVSRGEECRIALHVAGVDFEDVRIPRDAWEATKPRLPFARVPVLEHDGKPPIFDSNAILVYVGRTHGLHPTDAFEAARHEAMMGACEDARHVIGPTMRIADADARKAARERIAANELPAWLAAAERQLLHAEEGPFYGGAKLHVVDIKLFLLLRWLTGGALDHIPTTLVAAQPGLTRLHDAVRDHAGVKAWTAR